MQTYEVEIKSLLGSSERADEIRNAMKQLDPTCVMKTENRQLNHYFDGGTISKLSDTMSSHISRDAKVKLDDLAKRAKSFSVRTRDKDGEVLLVVKTSVGDDTSSNGVARMEFEEKVSMDLDELDALVLSSGFTYQAKWSRIREEYICKGVNVTLDKNAGYGWLAEFEKIVEDATRLEEARREIHALMQTLGADELPQDRLERMFAHYNAHWLEYYGTERIFVIE